MPQMIIFEMKKLKIMQKMKKFTKNLLMKHLKNQLLRTLPHLMKIIQERKNLISRNCPGQVLAELDGNLRNSICEKLFKTYEIQDPTCLIKYWVLKIFITGQTENYSENCEIIQTFWARPNHPRSLNSSCWTSSAWGPVSSFNNLKVRC